MVMDNAPTHYNCAFASLAELVEQQGQQLADTTAFVFEDDAGETCSWTYAELAERSRTLGAWLAKRVPVGERVLLVYPPGLEFIAAFFGCIYAGVLPVPATYPKPRRPMPRLDSIAADCTPSLILTHSSVLGGLCLEQQSPAIGALAWEATDQIATIARTQFQPVTRTVDDIAFLQYTSGSTSEPRGVMVTHGNLLHNLAASSSGFGIKPDNAPSAVFWLPAYHDMGLIGGILSPLFVGGRSTLIAPATFLRRPQRWLELISENQATISGAPNFGYELVVRKTTPTDRAALDLSHWRVAFCGAEPINPTMFDEFAQAFACAGFKPAAFYPCYGLAEATLMVTGAKLPSGPRILTVDRQAMQNQRVVTRSEQIGTTQAIVGCGAECGDLKVAIVDPHTRIVCEPDEVGEIWVTGGSVARGYWNKEAENAETFRARIVGKGAADAEYLRTGDLGFRQDGELFITGRLKDMIIVRGRNHYPQDLERTALAAHEAVEMGAAFSIEVAGHEELVLVHQWRRECRDADHNQIIHAIRTAIVAEHEIDPYAIVLIRPASLPVTSSGKVQRSRCREMYLQGELVISTEWINQHAGGDEFDASAIELTAPPEFLSRINQMPVEQLRAELEAWLAEWLSVRANLTPGSMRPTTPFVQLGIDSLTAVEISQELDQLLGLQSPPMMIWSCPNPAELAAFLAAELHASATADVG
jgi:acyl-CoA synthetase (AMP-forming)/AMP-acid ligase II/acyl carrier protein